MHTNMAGFRLFSKPFFAFSAMDKVTAAQKGLRSIYLLLRIGIMFSLMQCPVNIIVRDENFQLLVQN